MSGMRAWSWCLPALLAGCATTAPAPGPAIHLERSGGWLRTRDAVPLRVRMPTGFRLEGPTHRRAEFDGHPYEVSLGAFLGADEAVMVHGERVADGSGASNYDNLPEAGWPSGAFHLRSYCVDVAAADVAGEHDLAWLRSHRWEPSGTLAMEQYLATTPDHDREVVISLIVRGLRCSDKPAMAQALARLRTKVEVRAR
jgi:hypothetical protein